MKHINSTSKKGAELLKNYNRSNNWTIAQCYRKPSFEKTYAEYLCRKKMIEENGHDFRIMSFNTFKFTCGWKNEYGDLRVETALNSYLVTNLPF